MFRFAIRLLVLIGLIVGSVAVLAAPDETDTVANAGWEEMGVGSASGGGISKNDFRDDAPSVAIGPDDAPVVAWTNSIYGATSVYVLRWNGSSWIEMDGSASWNGVSQRRGSMGSPSLAIGPDGMPVVAWDDYSSGNSEIYLRRWNGSAWIEMGNSGSEGGISNNSGQSSSPSLTIDSNGMPIVAWDDDSSGNDEIYLRRWNGLSWVEIGGSASGGGISNDGRFSWKPSLAIGSDGAPIVVWNSAGAVYVRRWNGTAWVEMAGSASKGGIGVTSVRFSPSLAITPYGMPIVAWDGMNTINPDNYSEIYLRGWDGTAWVEMGGSASGGGISNDSGYSQLPSLAVGSDGMPIVAWDNYLGAGEPPRIYVRRWNGESWVEMDNGSASGQGISNDYHSEHVSMAIGPYGRLVAAWFNSNLTNPGDIYVRRYQPCYPIALTRSPRTSVNAAAIQGPNRLYLPSVLHVTTSYFSSTVEREPNNNPLQANGLLCSGHDYFGLPNDRYDVFSLEAVAGTVSINLANHIGTGVQLQLHHQTITTNPIAIDTNGADGYRLEVLNAPAGRYYIVISTTTPDPGATTRYQLTTTFNMSR